MEDTHFSDAGIAVFENRIIYEARPGISEAELERIEAKLAGPVPEDLKALWRLCYGGRLDYALDVTYGQHIRPFSFGYLFYPGGRDVDDLDHWI